MKMKLSKGNLGIGYDGILLSPFLHSLALYFFLVGQFGYFLLRRQTMREREVERSSEAQSEVY